MLNVKEEGNFYIIKPDNRNINYENYFTKGNNKEKKMISFSSDNIPLLNIKKIEKLLMKVKEVKKEL